MSDLLKKSTNDLELTNLADPNILSTSNQQIDNSNPKYKDYEEEKEDELIEIKDIDLKENTKDRMIFRKVPFSLWIVGTIIFIVAIYLLYTLALGYFGVLYKGNK